MTVCMTRPIRPPALISSVADDGPHGAVSSLWIRRSGAPPRHATTSPPGPLLSLASRCLVRMRFFKHALVVVYGMLHFTD